MAHYGAPVWAPSLGNRPAAKLNACQRVMAIRMVRGYRTISREAASLLAGLPPWDLEATVLARMHDLRVEMQRRGETRTRGGQSSGGNSGWHGDCDYRNIRNPVLGTPSSRRLGLSLRSGWKEERTPGCRHCVDRPEDTVEHTVEVCPAWAEHRRVLVEAIGSGDLSRRALVQAMVRSDEGWHAVASFCEAVMLVKEAADRERVRERSSRRRRRDLDPDFRPP
ncbi:hypothetical protein PYW07_005500 [Mythimna separata]|uniref:Reverse transcriptase n=1 Tax=Mythimna separata TaxID=271217 RepID=A0AAD8DS42_MYTSE|nr:hypothetical protein PYW07_005500 [Mythimna separata]